MRAGLAAGLAGLALLLLVDAAAGPSDCVSDLTGTICYDDPGPSLLTSVLASVAAAVCAAVVQARRRP